MSSGPIAARMIFSVTTHQQSISIRKSPEVVFDYATSPSRWHEWHPQVKRVDISIEGSAPAGMTFEEDTATIAGTEHLSWEVTSAAPYSAWIATAKMSTGGRLNLSYEVFGISEGSRFVRTLDYSFRNPILRTVDVLVVSHLMRRKSARSLQRLKKNLESGT